MPDTIFQPPANGGNKTIGIRSRAGEDDSPAPEPTTTFDDTPPNVDDMVGDTPTEPDPPLPAQDDTAPVGAPKKNNDGLKAAGLIALIALLLAASTIGAIYYKSRTAEPAPLAPPAPVVTTAPAPVMNDWTACGPVVVLPPTDTAVSCVGRAKGQYLSPANDLFACGCEKPLTK